MTTELLKRLARVHPHLVFRRLVVSGGVCGFRNDHVRVQSPAGDRRAFLGRLDEAVLSGEVDLTVRSLKDVPVEVPPGLALAAVLERMDPRDALCGSSLRELPPGARVGGSSMRRTAQLVALRPDLRPVRIRGSVAAQLQQLQRLQPLDAVVLPVAGLARLGLAGRIGEALGVEEFPPAPGQGALGVLVRSDDTELRSLLTAVHDPATAAAVEAERNLRAGLHEGCGLPIGGHAQVDGDGDRLRIIGQVTAPDGSRFARRQASGATTDAAALGRRLATDLRAVGADEILAEIPTYHG
jgi:hydroxymethylbilane synthase